MTIRMIALVYLLGSGAVTFAQMVDQNNVLPVIEQSGEMLAQGELDRCRFEPDLAPDKIIRFNAVYFYKPNEDLREQGNFLLLLIEGRYFPLKEKLDVKYSEPKKGGSSYTYSNQILKLEYWDSKGWVETIEVNIDPEGKHVEFYRMVQYKVDSQGKRTETSRIACGHPAVS